MEEQREQKPFEGKCPECGGDCLIQWQGLDLVQNSGDETLATKHYYPSAYGWEANKNLIELNAALRDEVERLKIELRLSQNWIDKCVDLCDSKELEEHAKEDLKRIEQLLTQQSNG